MQVVVGQSWCLSVANKLGACNFPEWLVFGREFPTTFPAEQQQQLSLSSKSSPLHFDRHETVGTTTRGVRCYSPDLEL